MSPQFVEGSHRSGVAFAARNFEARAVSSRAEQTARPRRSLAGGFILRPRIKYLTPVAFLRRPMWMWIDIAAGATTLVVVVILLAPIFLPRIDANGRLRWWTDD